MTNPQKQVSKKSLNERSELDKYQVYFELNEPWEKAKHTVRLHPHK